MKKTDSTFILKSLINNIPTAVFWKDADLVFRGCNKEFSQQFGFSDPEKIIGKTDFDFPFSEHLRKKYNKDDREVLAGIYKVNYEEKQTQPNGSQKTLLVSKVPYYDDNQKIIGILGIYTDISHLKEIEQNLLIAKEKAENANQVKTEFIRNMEHDIRTPFCGIWGLANLLHEEETDPLKKSYLDDISSSAKELMDFCNSILDASMTELGALPILEKKT